MEENKFNIGSSDKDDKKKKSSKPHKQKKRTTHDNANVEIPPSKKQADDNDKLEMSDDDDAIYEDPYEDEYEEEIVENNDENMETDNQDMMEADEEGNVKVFNPAKDKLDENEVLEYDSAAYDMLHQMKVEWPCLSFDVLPDKLGFQRTRYPITSYFIGGTQADVASNNKLMIFKASSLHKTKHDEDSDYSDDDDDLDEDPELEYKSVPHPGGVNRLKIMPQEPNIVATWAETGHVHLWNVTPLIKALDQPPTTKLPNITPIKTLSGHTTEGFALHWSTQKAGRLLSGDCDKHIFLTEMHENGAGWAQDTTSFTGHKSSVEDLQWSPSEVEVFASCSSDKTIKIWDTRQKKTSARSFVAADTDVNVISWNKKVPYLLLSGADDGSFRIWDLRSLKANSSKCESVGHYEWHTDQITSVEWDPNDESTLAVCGADNQLTIWDLAVEKDDADSTNTESDFPPQMLFIHQGQTDIKELHWHPQIPNMIISTAEDGFNIFKPNITEGSADKAN